MICVTCLPISDQICNAMPPFGLLQAGYEAGLVGRVVLALGSLRLCF